MDLTTEEKSLTFRSSITFEKMQQNMKNKKWNYLLKANLFYSNYYFLLQAKKIWKMNPLKVYKCTQIILTILMS